MNSFIKTNVHINRILFMRSFDKIIFRWSLEVSFMIYFKSNILLLTNSAMFGIITRSSSVPLLISGTYFNGCIGIADNVPLSLKATFACSNDSLQQYDKIMLIINLSFTRVIILRIQFFSSHTHFENILFNTGKCVIIQSKFYHLKMLSKKY